jgi:ATP/maltotriose-dependent transcriptional regulator MalT
MLIEKETIPILIQTKLNRPSLPADMVYRPRLTQWLKWHQRRPLTLVSAPAGYGKSTLINCWLSSADCPSAWVSLDEHDNQLGNFLSYFLAAVQAIFPNALPETQTLLLVTPQTYFDQLSTTPSNLEGGVWFGLKWGREQRQDHHRPNRLKGADQ